MANQGLPKTAARKAVTDMEGKDGPVENAKPDKMTGADKLGDISSAVIDQGEQPSDASIDPGDKDKRTMQENGVAASLDGDDDGDAADDDAADAEDDADEDGDEEPVAKASLGDLSQRLDDLESRVDELESEIQDVVSNSLDKALESVHTKLDDLAKSIGETPAADPVTKRAPASRQPIAEVAKAEPKRMGEGVFRSVVFGPSTG